MKGSQTHNHQEIAFDTLIESLKDIALCRNFEEMKSLLEPFFSSDLDEYSQTAQAYLKYYLGYYYVHSGQAKNFHHQETGRDFLTSAHFLFNSLDKENEAIEAQISLGWSYYQTGAISNYEAFLLDALSMCSPQSEAYLSVSVSLLIVYYRNAQKEGQKEIQTEKAFALINEISEAVKECPNQRIKWQFFINSGLNYRVAEKYQKAVLSYKKAITIAKDLKNLRFEGQTINCLAYCHKASGETEAALLTIEEAYKIFKILRDDGLIAETLDTKALILAKQGDSEEALNTINKALFYFRDGENYLGYADSLWNKITILRSLNKQSEIFETFRELSNLAYTHLGNEKQKEFYQKFSEFSFIPNGKTFKEKVTNFQKSLVLPVIESSGGIVEAARRLGFDNHQTLANLLKRGDPQKQKAHTYRKEIFSVPKPRIVLKNGLNIKKLKFFQISSEASTLLNLNSPVKIAISETEPLKVNDLVLIKTYGELELTKIIYEDKNFHFITSQGNTVTDSNALWIGVVVGFIVESKNEIFFKQIKGENL